MPVTRIEIADLVEDAFGEGGVRRRQLIEHAQSARARRELILVLERLPDRTYNGLRDLWPHLEDVPVEKAS